MIRDTKIKKKTIQAFIFQTGDYNKPIPAQYDDRLNHPAGCAQEEFISGDELLCHRCSQNQLLKVKQLANFVPYSEVGSTPILKSAYSQKVWKKIFFFSKIMSKNIYCVIVSRPDYF